MRLLNPSEKKYGYNITADFSCEVTIPNNHKKEHVKKYKTKLQVMTNCETRQQGN
jgi:hypothetical protein